MALAWKGGKKTYEAGDRVSLLVLQHLAVVLSFLPPLLSHPDTVKGAVASGVHSRKVEHVHGILWSSLPSPGCWGRGRHHTYLWLGLQGTQGQQFPEASFLERQRPSPLESLESCKCVLSKLRALGDSCPHWPHCLHPLASARDKSRVWMFRIIYLKRLTFYDFYNFLLTFFILFFLSQGLVYQPCLRLMV